MEFLVFLAQCFLALMVFVWAVYGSAGYKFMAFFIWGAWIAHALAGGLA